MKFKIIVSLFSFLVFLSACSSQKTTEAQSPDGSIVLNVGIDEGRLYYTLNKKDKPVLNKSYLGFELKDSSLKNNFHIVSTEQSSFSEKWDQPWGEEITVNNTYNQLKINIEEKDGLKRQFSVVFRIFNDGFGFRYEFPEQENLKDFIIMDELTEFSLAGDHKAWSIPYDTEFYEGLYTPSPVSQLDTVCGPLTMETADGQFLAIHEANLTDYAAMNLFPENKSTVLRTYLTPWSTGEKVFMKAPHTTPWRTMIIVDSAGDLLLSRLMLNLNEPSKIEDTSWIQPGRYIGIWWGMHMKKYTWEEGPKHGATTENTIRYIDFAAKHNFQGVLVEGWNKGWEDWKSFEFTTPYSDFDIAKITDYAAAKNVKLIGHHETGGSTLNYEKQMDSAFAYYEKYGVNAVKTGYVGGKLDGKEMHSSQYGVRHYRKVIETAAQHHIMIDNHEPVMPTGLQRTYPNLMTQEGVRGQEWNAWSKDGGNPPEHTTIIPFTRGLAAPTDFTPVIFNFDNPVLPQTRVRTTLAKQLALFVVLYSPLQMAADMIENYENNPAPFEFITSCPVNWSKTIIPHAKIGEYITIARKDRNSENWYVGSITNADKRQLTLNLDFLEKGAKYKAKIFKDGANADYESNPYPVDIEEIEVTSDSKIDLNLARSGGSAIIIQKL
ncbi:glycoside hydrolase family 97 protein [Dysgonomonas macrotermitis]|uniref:Alpha-glucosidase n=1 Tax=Dysgonomonas macrotermitis TaxID=1346286 RepID=A0A1M4SF09_9BACT|nr:glycoside hydrolase family 97 protein [Dysgonomonas macrotermitis]SHE30789.1 alpha-glucosidase [Dysgonomonas macrotermitis]